MTANRSRVVRWPTPWSPSSRPACVDARDDADGSASRIDPTCLERLSAAAASAGQKFVGMSENCRWLDRAAQQAHLEAPTDAIGAGKSIHSEDGRPG